ncbi:Uncharacterised protein [Anaerotruncus colihominis]|jgi:hypothetical protein|uniref:Uncharacterized protein n=1 Tax=Anaerotruncus colihominis TaxID=169435 RepID=A0A174R0G6_9FIRM|nr:Uncharacterised protein [Anaerotruncus colihominis]
MKIRKLVGTDNFQFIGQIKLSTKAIQPAKFGWLFCYSKTFCPITEGNYSFHTYYEDGGYEIEIAYTGE